MNRDCTAGETSDWNGDGWRRTLIATMTKSIIRCGRAQPFRRSRGPGASANYRRLPKIQSQCFYYEYKLSRRSRSRNKWLDLLSKSLYFIPSASRTKLLTVVFSHTEKRAEKRLDIFFWETATRTYCRSTNLTIISFKLWRLSLIISRESTCSIHVELRDTFCLALFSPTVIFDSEWNHVRSAGKWESTNAWESTKKTINWIYFLVNLMTKLLGRLTWESLLTFSWRFNLKSWILG